MGPTLHQLARKGFLYVYVTAGFIIVLDTLHVSLEPIAAADHLTGAKKPVFRTNHLADTVKTNITTTE